MTERKHTPGPWRADIRVGCFAVYPESESHNCLDDGVSETAVVFQEGRGDSPTGWSMLTDEQVANANLIGSATDLLAACEMALMYLGFPIDLMVSGRDEVKLALATAIAKATKEVEP